MTSRRPMTRSLSGNGRTSSFGEEEGSSSIGRTESRNPYLSSVRPENSYSRYSHYRPTRSTLCSVMAQLTEDIQPSFDTTLKSKAVSEKCNVKFTCMVSGYPAPQLKWYKDDMELDRYCGLPKYEIHRNDKIHTLQIYNCTLDDAAIYQVSASNNKGIVSCSGVLEVGTMNEFQIHQRFFAKLKQKADKKKKDLEEHTKKRDKENTEHPQRKRRVPLQEERPLVQAEEQLGAAAEPNGVSSEIKETASVTSKDLDEIPPFEDTLTKNKIKITNGVDEGVNNSSRRSSRSNMMENGGENCYDGGMGLAQFMAETLQSRDAEEKQSSSRGENPKEMDIPIVSVSKEKEREQDRMQKVREEQEKALEEEYERKKRREGELAVEKEKERERLSKTSHTVPFTKHSSEVKHHSKAHKDHDHHSKAHKDLDHHSKAHKDLDHHSKAHKDPDHHSKAHKDLDHHSKAHKDLDHHSKAHKDHDHHSKAHKDLDHHSKDHKDHDHHNIQASISSVLHTVKDFFFGKSKKDSHDHMENKEREFDHSHAATPPSFRLQTEQNQVCKPLTEDIVAMETDRPKETSQTVDTEQSQKPHELNNEDMVLHTDQPPAHKLLPESVEVSTARSVNVADAAVEAVEVSVGQESGRPGQEVLTEAEEKDPQIVSVTKEDPTHQQEPACLVVSPQPNHQAARDKSSPREEISVLPQTQDYFKEECSSTSTLTSLEESWTFPHNRISVSNSHSLGEAFDKTSREEKTSVDKMGKEASLRKFMSKAAPDSEVITVGDRQMDRADEDLSGGSTPTSSLSCENSPRLKRRDSLSLIRSATPEELASGARRKIFIPKTKEDGEGAVVTALETQGKKETPYMSPSQARRAALLQTTTGQNTPPMERRSPLLSRRKATLEVPKSVEQTPTEEPVSTKQDEKPAEKKLNPLKAPQVIRKIRGEPFPDASGHLKMWCQFFNVLSDSTIKWYRDEEEIVELKRSGGDESQVALAVVLASSHDCGVYGCSISNEYGTDTTDFLLSVDILSEILLKEDLEGYVGEEIEMTPLLFNRGLADCGSWAEKYFGRIMTETVHIGEGCTHKASRVKVIYGLDPIFDSGSACIIKVQSPIAYGTTQESNLTERNLQITKQECKVQNMIREYCKIFAAEARVTENFGFSLEVIAQYLMYRPANSVPYATVEAYFEGVFLNYCMMDPKGRLITRNVSELEQKCSTFQHWIHQWTHGNLLVTRLEGVETKITNVRVVTKSKGYQGLTEHGSPEVLEQFSTHHQCNYYCGLLGLRSLKTTDSLQQPTKMKGSRSPLLNRKLGSNSPQLQRKEHSPQMSRKANSSPKVTRKNQETEDNKLGDKPQPAETVDVLEMR
ncbi:hypothetical protein VZT92_024614 [Zoarces viviparus]|uniref:non-specific serine/threonine protein kinase n=1 Tax=Zoarces viviparus TaxID=48416 RepID=A0AAW1E250_ZOAVI